MESLFDKYAGQFGTYSDYLSNRQMQMTAPEIKVYLLDRERGTKAEDAVYGEVINRVYLPYYTIRGMYLTQDWTQPLGKNAVTNPDVDVMTIVFNFNDMVGKMRKLKDIPNSKIYVSYSGLASASIQKNGNILTIKEDCNIIEEIDVSNYCLEELIDYIHALTKLDCRGDGDLSESATNLVDFESTFFNNNEEVEIYTLNKIYNSKKIGDFIESGDMIVTHHNVLYEVMDYFVANLRMKTWVNYVVKCEKRELSDQVKLPNDGLKDIHDNWLLLGQYDWARK